MSVFLDELKRRNVFRIGVTYTVMDTGEIAQQLGVAHIVEGSVRRIGDDLRVTAQLIRADDGFHLWSTTFAGNRAGPRLCHGSHTPY